MQSKDGEQARKKLLGDYRSTDDLQHAAAEWELYLHEALVQMGLYVEVDPDVGGGLTPDFAVRRAADGPIFCYVEATVANPDAEQRRGNKLLQEFTEALKRPLAGYGCLISVQVRSRGTKPIAGGANKGKGFLAAMKGGQGAAESIRTEDGWHLDIAIGAQSGGQPEMMLGEAGVGGTYAETKYAAIRAAVKKKASKYKQLAAPYVVAVQVRQMSQISRQNVVEALNGTVVAHMGQAFKVERESNMQDGAFGSAERQHKHHVSAILFVQNFGAYVAATVAPELFLHPAADLPLELGVLDFTTLMADDSLDAPTEVHSGRDPHDLLGISSTWPDVEAFSEPYRNYVPPAT